MNKMDFLYFFLILCPKINVMRAGTKIFEMEGIIYMLIRLTLGKEKEE